MNNYQALKDHFAEDARVIMAEGRGAQGMKVLVKGKPRMVVMFSNGDLLLQLPPPLVAGLIKEGKGEAYDPGTGKPMKDRVLIPVSRKQSWISLVELTIDSADEL